MPLSLTFTLLLSINKPYNINMTQVLQHREKP